MKPFYFYKQVDDPSSRIYMHLMKPGLKPGSL